ncbi:magnesium transporter [Leptospira sp. GIMC2001]|uniref:magnesium transporter n=1 Tax=Leptospira sp. GIMC2001 TaxID=1513297 RepID=UPI00234934B6|nr:magnesium transporter [Leptospira sp. GIMC2001]WCL48121.1 magnesium transporter [Leptospira sp. GIMC2001]
MEPSISPEPTNKIPPLESEAFEIWLDRLSEFIKTGKDNEILDAFDNAHYADIAECIQELEDEEAFYVFRLFDPIKQSEILVELDEEFQSKFLEKLQPKEISPIFENLESDDITFILGDVRREKVEEVLKNLDKEDSHQIRTQLEFNENTAGRIMSSDFASVSMNDTVQKAIAKVRKVAKEVDDIYLVYVTEKSGKLVGFLRLKDLLLSSPTDKIHKIMDSTVFSVHFNTDQEDVAFTFRKYDLVSIAVVDDEERVIGRITVDDVLDILQDEASEDIYRMGGLSEDEKLTTPVLESLRKRIVWLIVNLATATLAASIVSIFEDTIQQVVVLATLMPIVAGMGGNAGTQSITVVVRNLATGELTIGTWWEAVRKETSIGILNGIFLGCLAGILVFFFKQNLALSLVIASAMMVNMSLAGLVGSSIPLILKIFRIDPAIASSIFVTTFTDVCGFFFFLGLANYFMKYLL